MDLNIYSKPSRRIFYGWWIVAVGVLTQIAGVFSLSSTLSIFLKPVTEDLGVSRGAFSLVRTGEILVSAAMAPLVGPIVDRRGGRKLIVAGAVIAAAGYFLLSRVQQFWQFFLVRCTLVVAGDTLMGSVVVMVIISHWFVRKRGRAIAIANLGTGVAKVTMPLLAAALFVSVGWRQSWALFAVFTLLLVVGPALLFIRSSPEDMGLRPDGEAAPPPEKDPAAISPTVPAEADVPWTRGEALRTRAFWLLGITFGIANIGIAGLNLHIFSFVTDLGHPALTAATVMSTVALTQLASTLLWGLVAERMDIRKAAMAQFLIQAVGIIVALMSARLDLLYAGFFIYGIGLGGSFVLREVVWANFFGRISLGTVRGMGVFLTNVLAACGAPFFGFLFDLTGSYTLSFTVFVGALLASAFLIMSVKPPRKAGIRN
ncbi:MAG TPA: MFS transporter [Candidatus Binatia bacterium]